jgi:hypothetical protein
MHDSKNRSASILRVKQQPKKTLLRLLDPEDSGTALVAIYQSSRRNAPEDVREKNGKLFTDTLRSILCHKGIKAHRSVEVRLHTL